MKKTIKTMGALMMAALFTVSGYAQKPSAELLNPGNHTLVLVDHESQMAFAVKNIETNELRNNTAISYGVLILCIATAIFITWVFGNGMPCLMMGQAAKSGIR